MNRCVSALTWNNNLTDIATNTVIIFLSGMKPLFGAFIHSAMTPSCQFPAVSIQKFKLTVNKLFPLNFSKKIYGELRNCYGCILLWIVIFKVSFYLEFLFCSQAQINTINTIWLFAYSSIHLPRYPYAMVPCLFVSRIVLLETLFVSAAIVATTTVLQQLHSKTDIKHNVLHNLTNSKG